jgi:hypothetical protein
MCYGTLHPMPVVEHTLTVDGAKYFSKLDANSEFLADQVG